MQYIILDLTPVSHVDAMGLHFLEELVFETRKAGQQLVLANPSMKVRVCSTGLAPTSFLQKSAS